MGRFGPADRTEQFPQIQEADMTSFRAAGAGVLRVAAYLTCIHSALYLFKKAFFKKKKFQRDIITAQKSGKI